MSDQPHYTDPLFLAFQAALAGRYSIERELGRGGMGVVYLAHEVHLDRVVAIKLLPPTLSVRPELRERFLREAQLAAKLSHPNIIPIHAVERADEFVYYVMAFVDGETLAQRVQQRGPLSASEATRVLREVAWALGHAHGQGLVHRDVKPDNILVERGTGRALVADFGIAAVAGDAQGDGISGTPEFMSPEQALGSDVDARSDLYSLGATAYYALSGRLPFEGKTATQVLARQVTEAAPLLASAGVSTPRTLAQLVDRLLCKDPSRRPQTAQSVADQLTAAIEQRRELPAALRAFVKRNGRMDGGGTLFSLVGALLASIATAATLGLTAGVLLLGASAALIPAVFAIVAARRLLNLGFAQADLGNAFRTERESIHEERSVRGFSRFSLRTWIERALGAITRIAASASTALVPFALAAVDTPRFSAIGSLVVAGYGAAAAAAFGYLVLLQLRRDVDVEFWSAAWTGRPGTMAFALARRWRGAGPVGVAMTHRATELSLGMAAEQLFASLPKASREALGDVPALLQRLQADAHALRGRCNALQEGLTQAVVQDTSAHALALRDEHTRVHGHLREAVGALETIRLGLLRLHAGSLTLDGLTTQVGQAAEASADVERLIAANNEVDAMLRFPRELELTPA